jgi:hypothetical protein
MQMRPTMLMLAQSGIVGPQSALVAQGPEQ